MPTVIVAAIALPLIGLALHTLYIAYLGPLSKIPNAHWSAPLSQAWKLWSKWSAQENTLRRAAHQRLGPIIRVGPNEVAVNCFEQGIQKMSGNNSFDKASWYSGNFDNYGLPPMFAILAGRQHDDRKRLVYKPYTNSRVQSSARLDEIVEEVLSKKLQATLRQSFAARTPVDAVATGKATALDLTSAYLFGLEHSTRLVGDAEVTATYLGAFQGSFIASFFVAEVFGNPPLLQRLGLFQRPAVAQRAKAFMEETCTALCKRCLGSPLQADSKDEPSVAQTMHAALAASRSTPPALRQRTLECEMLDHLVAGTESLGTTIAYLLYELSRAPDIQKTLRTVELPTLASQTGRERARALDALPLLDAIVRETLRVRPPGLGPFPRVVPPAGAILANTPLPGGTLVSASVRCLHADPAVYDEPDVWRPARWTDDAAARGAMDANFWPFGSGSRVCVANHFSMRLMKEFVASVYSRFETSVLDDSGAAQTDGVIAGPVGERIDIAVRELEAAV